MARLRTRSRCRYALQVHSHFAVLRSASGLFFLRVCCDARGAVMQQVSAGGSSRTDRPHKGDGHGGCTTGTGQAGNTQVGEEGSGGDSGMHAGKQKYPQGGGANVPQPAPNRFGRPRDKTPPPFHSSPRFPTACE